MEALVLSSQSGKSGYLLLLVIKNKESDQINMQAPHDSPSNHDHLRTEK